MKKVVTFGEIMLRLSPPGFLRFSQTTSLDVVMKKMQKCTLALCWTRNLPRIYCGESNKWNFKPQIVTKIGSYLGPFSFIHLSLKLVEELLEKLDLPFLFWH